MCFHDDILGVTGLSYSFVYNLTEVFPYLGGTRTDTFTSNFTFTMTRVTLASKGIRSPLQVTGGLAGFLNPGEFFLESTCCCPCNWTFIPLFDTFTSVATQSRSVVYASNPPPNISGNVVFGGTIDFTIVPNIIQYDICGNNVTYAPQSAYWPTFDGVTPLDPAYFVSGAGGIDVQYPVQSYTGDPSLNPGGGSFDGGSTVSPFQPGSGYFLFYDPTTGPPPTPIPGVTGSGNGFRNPCNPAMNFNQTVSWSMTAGTTTGTGNGSIAIAFT